MREMMIDSIRVSLMNYQRVVILKQQDSDRYLPIWIGPAEADAIAVKLQDIAVPRPLTHDLLINVVHAMGAQIKHVIVNDLQNDTFFAKVVLELDGKSMEIDARPSDAIALAVRANAHIYADDTVLDKAGVQLDKETGKPVIPEEKPGEEKSAQVREEEIRRLSAFKDFIEGLDLEGLGKSKS